MVAGVEAMGHLVAMMTQEQEVAMHNAAIMTQYRYG